MWWYFLAGMTIGVSLGVLGTALCTSSKWGEDKTTENGANKLYRCSSGLHWWPSKRDADACCSIVKLEDDGL